MAALHCWDQLKTENSSDNLVGNVFESLQGDLLKEKHYILIEVPYKKGHSTDLEIMYNPWL